MRFARFTVAVVSVLVLSGCGRESPQAQAVRRQMDILQQGDAESRVAAAAELGRMRATNAVEALINASTDIRPDVRVAAVEALVQIGDPRASGAFCRQLKSSEWRSRQLAAQGLGGIRDPSAVPFLREAMRDEHVAVATAAAAALSSCGSLDVLKAAASATNEPTGAREAALLILGESGPACAGAIAAALRDTNATVRMAAFSALAKTGGASEAPLLIDGLLDRASGVRKASEKALLAMEPDVVLPSLTAELERGTAERQMAVLKMLEADRTARGVGVLAAALVSERPPVRAAAGKILADRRQQFIRAKKDARMLPAKTFLKALSSSNEAVRAAAMTHLEEDAILNRSAEPVLKDALKDRSATVRQVAARLMADLKADGLAEALTPLLGDADVEVRRTAAVTLAEQTNETAIAILVEGVDAALRVLPTLGDEKDQRSRAATSARIVRWLRALGASRSPKALQVTVRALDARDDAIEEAALDAIRDIGDKSVYDKVTPFLGRMKWGEQQVRRAAIEAMVALDPARAADTLVPLLANKGKWQAESNVSALCRVLARIKEPRAADAMIDRLFERYADASGKMDEVKVAAAAGLVELGELAVPTIVRRLNETKVREGVLALILGRIGEPAVKPCIDALKSEDPLIRKNAAWALGHFKQRPEIVDPLAGLLADKDPGARTAAAWALGQMQARKAVPGLTAMLESGNPKERVAAAEALGRIGDTSTVAGLVRLLQDADPEVRIAGVSALGVLGDASAAEPLRRAAKEDKEERVRLAAAEALASLGAGQGK